jgi:hypothetical protein
MIRLAHPMDQAMPWPRRHGPEDLARALAGLPADVTVRPLGGAHLVVGPAGAQVVALDDGSPGAPRAAARLASVVRSALAEEVPWMPFVHALLITDRPDPCPPATRISPALLLRAVSEGPVTLDAAILERLRQAIEDGALDGLAAVAPADTTVPTSR